MKEHHFPVVIEQDEDGWFIGTVPESKGCHTQARDLAELDKRLRNAIKLCLEVEKAEPSRNTFIGVHQIQLAR